MARSAPPKEYQLPIKFFLGMMISINNTQIGDNRTPEVLNVLPDDRGAIDKRHGQTNLFVSLGSLGIKSLMEYKKDSGTIYLFNNDDKVYKIDDLDLGTYSLVFTGTANTQFSWFTFNDIFYVLDGTTYYQYDGTTWVAVTGYIPIVTTGTPPAGGGTTLEPFNLISAGFRQLFSGDAASTIYQLIETLLDATLLIIIVDGVTLTETVNFTVDRTLGQVNFAGGSAPHGAPSGANPNNVDITAYKTEVGASDKIFKSTISYLWGGSADGTRVWFSGNPDVIGTDYRSGLLDPTYFPADGDDEVGQNDNPITGYSALYDVMIVFKQNSIYKRSYFENSGDPEFPTAKINDDVGCIAPRSISVLENFPTFVTRKGVYMLVGIDTRNERTVVPISDAIDQNINILSQEGFLELGNLENYVGIDYNNNYWLFNPESGLVWVYDYRYLFQEETIYSDVTGQWFLLDNMYADALLDINDNLYWGDSRKGNINRFFEEAEQFDYSDSEITAGDPIREPILASWVSKIFNFGSSTNTKLLNKIFFSLKPAARTSASLYVRSSLNSPWKFVKTKRKSLFVYSLIKYSIWTYGGSIFPQMVRQKIKAKKVQYFQMKLENNELFESMGILDTTLTYQYQREVKN